MTYDANYALFVRWFVELEASISWRNNEREASTKKRQCWSDILRFRFKNSQRPRFVCFLDELLRIKGRLAVPVASLKNLIKNIHHVSYASVSFLRLEWIMLLWLSLQEFSRRLRIFSWHVTHSQHRLACLLGVIPSRWLSFLLKNVSKFDWTLSLPSLRSLRRHDNVLWTPTCCWYQTEG